MQFGIDGKNQTYIEWEIGAGGWKRAWVQDRSQDGPDKDWAGTGRYLNVVRIENPGGRPAGFPTDFPIYCQQSDRQILRAFVFAVTACTGGTLPDTPAV